mgnify:CR=1 FL=1
MTSLAFDSSTVITWVLKERGWSAVDRLLRDADGVVLPSPALMEVIRIARLRGNRSAGRVIADTLAAQGLIFVHADTDDLIDAAALLEAAAQLPGAQLPRAQRPGVEPRGGQRPGAPRPGAQVPSAEVPVADLHGAQRPGVQLHGAPRPGGAHGDSAPSLSTADALILTIASRLDRPVVTRDRLWGELASAGLVRIPVHVF